MSLSDKQIYMCDFYGASSDKLNKILIGKTG